jgi:hypothetical protein
MLAKARARPDPRCSTSRTTGRGACDGTVTSERGRTPIIPAGVESFTTLKSVEPRGAKRKPFYLEAICSGSLGCRRMPTRSTGSQDDQGTGEEHPNAESNETARL